jgi:hypothetical protein
VPVAGGHVLFHPDSSGVAAGRYSASGEIGPDGGYRLSTFKPEDGAIAGHHRVVVVPGEERPGDTTPIPGRYGNMVTSGLEYEVRPGENDIPIRLASQPTN